MGQKSSKTFRTSRTSKTSKAPNAQKEEEEKVMVEPEVEALQEDKAPNETEFGEESPKVDGESDENVKLEAEAKVKADAEKKARLVFVYAFCNASSFTPGLSGF